MKNKLFKPGIISLVFVFFSMTMPFLSFPAYKNIKQGNRLYQQEKFDDALEEYRKAEVSLPDSEIVKFDVAAALYKIKDYEKAIAAYNKVLLSDDLTLEEKAAYNIGNSNYRLGELNKDTDLPSAIDSYKQAIGYYERAIELNPDSMDAKYNYEFVKKELEVLLEKLEQQSQKEKDQGTDKQEERGEQKEAEKESTEEEKQQKNKAEQEMRQPEDMNEEMAEKKEDKTKKEEEGTAESGAGEEKEMSEDEARMLLENLLLDEQTGFKLDDTQRGKDRGVVKDW